MPDADPSLDGSAPVRTGDPRIGTVLGGRYTLSALLGEGGVGQVYRARDGLAGVEVAVKVLRPEQARRPEICQRFLREARAAKRVRHPHVVEVLDTGEDNGVPYMVQELLVGADLLSYVQGKGNKLRTEDAVRLMMPVIDAVALAHARGVVHRDLKPENVFMVREAGGYVPKLLDFGISKILQPESADDITVAGVSMGTPRYMSPEQIQSFGQLDARSDVWTLGVMLYELISGADPYESTATVALFREICTTDPIPLETFAPDVPPAVSAVIRRCMQRTPAMRFAHAGELGDALADAMGLPRLPGGRRITVESSGTLGGATSLSDPTPSLGQRVSQPDAVTLLDLANAAPEPTHASQPAPVASAALRPSDVPTARLLALRDLTRLPVSPRSSAPITSAPDAPVDEVTTETDPAIRVSIPRAIRSEVPGTRSLPGWLIALVAAGLALAVVAGSLALRPPASRTGGAAMGPRGARPQVRLELSASTPRASAVVRGREVALPCALELEAASAPEQVLVRAPGMREQRVSVTLDHSLRVRIDLDPE